MYQLKLKVKTFSSVILERCQLYSVDLYLKILKKQVRNQLFSTVYYLCYKLKIVDALNVRNYVKNVFKPFLQLILRVFFLEIVQSKT